MIFIVLCCCVVRQKAKDLISFLQDDERLRDSRKNARKTRDKYVGISSTEQSDKYSELLVKKPQVLLVVYPICSP